MTLLYLDDTEVKTVYPTGTVFEYREFGRNNWRETDDTGKETALQFDAVFQARDAFCIYVTNIRKAVQRGMMEIASDVTPDNFDLIAIFPDGSEKFVETGEMTMEKIQNQ